MFLGEVMVIVARSLFLSFPFRTMGRIRPCQVLRFPGHVGAFLECPTFLVSPCQNHITHITGVQGKRLCRQEALASGLKPASIHHPQRMGLSLFTPAYF